MTKQGQKPERLSRGLRYVALLALGLTVLFIVAMNLLGDRFGFLHQLALEVNGPLQRVTSLSFKSLGHGWNDYIALRGMREENKRLWEELRECRAIAARHREAIATNTSLRRLLSFKEAGGHEAVTASIIGRDPSFWFRTVMIDRGSGDGLVKGMPAVVAEGVVGQVFAVAPNYTKVLLTTAPSSAIDVLLQKSRARGILKGNGSAMYQLDYILKNVTVEVGDQVVSAGIGGLFPTGLPVGTVSEIIQQPRGMFHEIVVQPSVDFQTLENVLIIRREVPRDAP